MGRKTFEDQIREKFEGQTVKTPSSIWNDIENSMNADFVSFHQGQQSFYKWLSIAALFIAALLLGVLLAPTNLKQSKVSESGNDDTASYNALLSNRINYDNYYRTRFSGQTNQELNFSRIEPSSDNVRRSDLENYADSQDAVFLANRRPSLALVESQHEIYRYSTLSSSYNASQKNDQQDSRMWAGVGAGAGTFDGNIGGSTLSNSLNPAGLASAIGSGNFVNPTTNISPEMNQAIATSVSFDFGVQINERWTLESGLAYTNVDNSGTASINVLDVFTIDNTNFEDGGLGGVDGGDIVTPSLSSREATIEVERNYDHEVEVNNRVQFASIPLKAGYFVVNKRFSLRVNAGLAANYLVNGSISDPTNQILNSDQIGLYNEWSFDGIGGMEFGYSIFDKFDFTIEPNYRHSITPISLASNVPSRFVLQTGIRYTLK